MPTKGCDISDFIQDLYNAKNPDGTRQFTDAQILGKLRKARHAGLISREQLIAAGGQPDILITKAEFTELEGYISEVSKSGKSIYEIFDADKLKRVLELIRKAKNSVGVGGGSRINQAKFAAMLDGLNDVTPTKTKHILDIIDKSIEKAERNGDKARAAKLAKIKDTLINMNDLSKRLKIDFNGLVKTNETIDKLTMEYALVKELLDIGDRETSELKKSIGVKLLNIRNEMMAVDRDPKLDDKEKQAAIAKLEIERQALMQKYNETTSKAFKANRKKLEKRLRSKRVEIQRLKDNTPNAFLNKILMSVTGVDPEFYVTNLRELKERQQKTADDITFVEKVLTDAPDDKTFSHAEVQALIGEDYTSTKIVKEMFYEPELNDDGTEKKDSSNVVIKKKKDSITKENLKVLVNLWTEYKRNKSYESTVSNLEATRIQNILLAGDAKLVSEVEPEDALPIARTHEEAKTAKVGYQYDPRKLADRVKGIRDLQSALQRLSFLSSLPNHKGYISTGMLVGVLGTDAQSLIHRFDDAVMDDLELEAYVGPAGETTLEGRRAVLQTTLLSMGLTNHEILSMPEFRDANFSSDFGKVVSYDLEWEPNTDNIIAMSVSVFEGGNQVPAHTEVIWSKQGQDKFFSKQDAQDALDTLQKYQNLGFKVVGHNTHGKDSDIQKLVSISENTKQGFIVALRSFDTMLLATRNTPLGTFTRAYGPSLDNLSKALGTGSKGSKAGVTGVTAFQAWKDAQLTGDWTNFTDYIKQDTVLAGANFLEMVNRHGKTVEVDNHRGKPQNMVVMDVSPIWWDTATPDAGRNQNYRGMSILFDITSFANLRESLGGGYNSGIMYDVGQLKTIAVKMILALMKADRGEELDGLMASLNTRDVDVQEQLASVLEISRSNHAAYLPFLRELREKNKNQFLLDADRVYGADISYSMTPTSSVYVDTTVEEILKTLTSYQRNPQRTIQRFATKIGFRKQVGGEDFHVYVKELFNHAATKFNGQPLTIEKFGNGEFDYVPAKQLGRGFAQLMIGQIEDGITLTQSTTTAIDEIDKRREEALLDGEVIAVDNEANLVEKREFLPITKQNVAYFAPLSMYEQERMYNDFALRQRYHYILNRNLTDDDIKNFDLWASTNPITEYKNSIHHLKALRRALLDKHLVTTDDVKKLYETYFPEEPVHITVANQDYLLGGSTTTEDKVKALDLAIATRTKEFEGYLKKVDSERLEQGRVQRYNLHLVTNNRSIFSRIPTRNEMEEMALEMALDLPQFVATFVHDSTTRMAGDEIFLKGDAYWEQPQFSSGGPTGAAVLTGIYPQLAWLLSHPEMDRDPETMKFLVKQSLENGIVLSKNGFSRTTYWDDHMSGIHHTLAMLWAYLPDQEMGAQGGLLNILHGIKTGNVGKQDLTDYYEETADQTLVALDKVEADLSAKGDTEGVAQIQKIRTYLADPASNGREFFKGAIVPRLYSAGYDGVLQGLRDKKKNKLDPNDPLKNLNDNDLKKLTEILTSTGIVVQGKLIDDILGLDSKRTNKLIDLFQQSTERLTGKLLDRVNDMFAKNADLRNNFINVDAARAGINMRLRTIAEYTMPAHLESAGIVKQEAWIEERVKFLQDKWQARIKNAEEIIKRNGGKIEIGSKAERDFHVALAGDEAGFKNQITLWGINQMQNSGLELNHSDRDILEASVMTARHISDSDLMFKDNVVHTMVGLGTGSGRAQYVQNYLTNLHGSRTSKGLRMVQKDDGSVDWKETITNSAWSLRGNALTGKTRAEAKKFLQGLVVKNYLLTIATDYTPDMIGYNTNDESRDTFFSEWQKRSRKEREWEAEDRLMDREKLKAAYLAEGLPALTDEDIDNAIQSNSVPVDKHIGTRIMAPTKVDDESQVIMSVEDAKGLAAFRPRLADNAFEDRIVHGLYTIYQGVRHLDTNVGAVRDELSKMEQDGVTPGTVFDMKNSRATQYDPKTLGVYYPETESTLVDDIFGTKPTFNKRVLRLMYVLDTFAMRNGLMELVEAKEYATLYQIYKIRQSLKKFSFLLTQDVSTVNELRFLHRNLVQQIFKLTKAQRDATSSKRNILDISKAIGIDPELFRDENNQNMHWLDVLRVLGDMGIDELGTVKFGMSPIAMLTTETNESPSVLIDNAAAIRPNVVQGADIAVILQGIFADKLVKEFATDYAKKAGIPFKTDPTGKYVELSSLTPTDQRKILDAVLDSDDLIMATADNLGLYVTLEIGAGENRVRFLGSRLHAKTDGFWSVPQRGLGTPTTNNVVLGSADVKFYLTPEAIKTMLRGARNAGFFNRIETAVQVHKNLGSVTRVDTMRRQRYAEYLDKHLDAIAEETDLLEALQGDNKLARLRTDRLRDTMGIEMNLYDAEHYFVQQDGMTGLTPFMNAITLDIRIAAQRASLYPALQTEHESLVRLLTKEENRQWLARIGFGLFVHYNVGFIPPAKFRALVEEHFGVKLTDVEWEEYKKKTGQVLRMMDKINHSQFKGKNKYLSLAIKFREQMMNNSHMLSYNWDLGNLIKAFGIPPEDHALAGQAVLEAYAIVEDKVDLPQAYASVPGDDLVKIASDSATFEATFPEGARINSELTQLKLDGVIDEETEIFYRFMIAKILKHNPNLAKFLSIKTEDLGTVQAGEAVKNGDRFVINLNPQVMKNLGRVDQMRIFAHEIAHIARLAFIKDNSPEWRQMESMFRSKKGAQAMEVMLLLMNNNKKYIGFEDDLKYFMSNPEEFIAQWGGWALLHGTFNNEDTMKFLQSRSSVAHRAATSYQSSFHRIRHEILSIASGLSELDEDVFAGIMDLTEQLYGFTSSHEREIHVANENKKLAMMGTFVDAWEHKGTEMDDLARLTGEFNATGTTSDNALFESLKTKYSVAPLHTLDAITLRRLRLERETQQHSSLVSSNHRFHPGSSGRRLEDLNTNQRMEIAQTFVAEAIGRRGSNSRNIGSMGGALRTTSETVFGKWFTNKAVWAQHYTGSMGLTQANKTYQSDNVIIASLMHVIGEGLSHTQGQYVHTSGSRGIRENRAYSQQWVDQVAGAVGNLQNMVSKDDFSILMEHVSLRLHGITTTMPVAFKPEVVAQVTEVVTVITDNNGEMQNFIYGDQAADFNRVPMQLDRAQIGIRQPHTNANREATFAANRELLITEVGNIVEENILNGALSSTMFYASGLGPRISGRGYQANLDTGVYPDDFIQEMKRVQKNHPAVFEVIFEIAVRELANTVSDEATARRILRQSMTDGSLLVNGQPTVHRVWSNASHTFYSLVAQQGNRKALEKAINRLNKAHTKYNMASHVMINFGSAIDAAIVDRTPIRDAAGLFVADANRHLPAGVSNLGEGQQSAIVLAAQKRTVLKDIIAGVFLIQLGENPAFLTERGLVHPRQLKENSKIGHLWSNRMDSIIADIERSKGFRATSALAIQDNTGIAGYDIYDILDIFDSLVPNIAPDEKSRKELSLSLQVIRQKLQIEQGIQSRHLGDEDDLFTNMLLKYGPAITRLAYGPNLNTASLIMEGALGVLIAQRYNGNALEFVADMFTGIFGNFKKATFDDMDVYAPRGLAVAMMHGMEHSARNAREVWESANDHGTDGPTRVQRFRNKLSRIQNAVYKTTAEALTNQAQRIIVEHLNNGNLVKLRDMMSKHTIQNMDELKKMMNAYGIKGIKPHMVFELKQAGVFEPGHIEAFNYMLHTVKSKHTKSGTLDFMAANRWIQGHHFSVMFVAKHGFTKEQAMRSVASMYEATKAFRNIVLVENNPWDSDTHSGVTRFLMTFYRQFPSLYYSQRMMRASGKVDTATFASILIATTILDLIYNSLLMVALGMIPLTALLPWHEHFLFREKPMTAIRLILGRNPIFGLTANLVGGTAAYTLETYMEAQKKVRGRQNRYLAINKAAGKGFDETAVDFIPQQAIETMFKGPMTAVLLGLSAGSNMTEQEAWDVKNGLLSVGSRLLPFVGELPVRMAMGKAIFGDRPGLGSRNTTVTPQKYQVPAAKPVTEKQKERDPFGAIVAPKGLR